MVHRYHKNVLRLLMKLPVNTPEASIYFLAGSLPVTAFLHQRQLTLFSMICHLQGNFLQLHAIDILTNFRQTEVKSWFHLIVTLCQQYDLPHPLCQLHDPIPRTIFKKVCKEKIFNFWRSQLTKESNLRSLQFMKSSFISLMKPHPIWTSLDGNPYQAKAAFIQASFLSGKYRTEMVSRFWTKNIDGFCLLGNCFDLKLKEDIRHVLLHCSALNEKRRRLESDTFRILASNPIYKPIVDSYLFSNDDDLKVQFLLDCNTLPMVIRAHQFFGDIVHGFLFKISRSWCRSLHNERMKLLGRPSK